MKHLNNLLYSSLMATGILLFSACQKNAFDKAADTGSNIENKNMAADGFIMKNYPDMSFLTRWELQQARAATAKYQNINNALADGYQNINVDVENMGHHFMKLPLVDKKFDFKQPEILVYNSNADGNQQLVAVEYAVPLSEPRPEGFAGDADLWDGNEGFQLWLLHAWVWYNNPAGVFQPFNPLVHLH